LRDIPIGLVPQNIPLSTTTIAVGTNAFFAAGVPELANGGIKTGYRWGTDPTTGDLVFYSISFSQPPIEAVRFGNTGQTIRWRSTENVYGELSHANTGNQRYTFPDKTGTVALTSDIGNVTTTTRQQLLQSTSGTTFVDSTNLKFSVLANTNYYFRFVIQYVINTAVSGSKIQITGPAAPSNLRYWASTENIAGTIVNNGTQTSFSTDVGYAAATSGTTYLCTIEGILENGANAGAVTLQFACGTALDLIQLLQDSFVVVSTVS
jgi:hypothetical protein